MVVGARRQEPLKRLYRGPSLFLTRFDRLWRPRGYLWHLPLDWGALRIFHLFCRRYSSVG